MFVPRSHLLRRSIRSTTLPTGRKKSAATAIQSLPSTDIKSKHGLLHGDNAIESTSTPDGSLSSSSSKSDTHLDPRLQEIPTLPFLGSLVPSYSGTPPLDMRSFYKYFPQLRSQFGNFYKMGFPGWGKGSTGEIYVLSDPNEMMKVLRQEKTSAVPYPLGITSATWPIRQHFEDDKAAITKDGGTPSCPFGFDRSGSTSKPLSTEIAGGFFGRGESWRRMRVFMQTDLLSPQAARGFVGRSPPPSLASPCASSSWCRLS